MTAKQISKNFAVIETKECKNGVWSYQVSGKNHAAVWSYRDRKGRIQHEAQAIGPLSWPVPRATFESGVAA